METKITLSTKRINGKESAQYTIQSKLLFKLIIVNSGGTVYNYKYIPEEFDKKTNK